MKQVLFLCTGNYYRSRFAEELFNHHAAAGNLPWRATSRALAIERGAANIGPMSKLTLAALSARGIPPEGAARMPAPCTQADLEGADLVVAVKEDEHRILLVERHPGWDERVTFWNVHDIEDGPAEIAIASIDHEVVRLIDKLKRR